MILQADADLITKAKQGDRFAFDQLVGPLVGQGFRLAFGMLHDREAAEDAVQEAAVRSWRKLSNLRPGTEMRPWFLGIVANQCRTISRGRWWSVLRLDVPMQPAGTAFEDRLGGGADLRARSGEPLSAPSNRSSTADWARCAPTSNRWRQRPSGRADSRKDARSARGGAACRLPAHP